MILVVDIGNTDIVWALAKNQNGEPNWLAQWRMPANRDLGPKAYQGYFRDKLAPSPPASTGIEKVLISSVVPSLTLTIQQAIEDLTGCEGVILGPQKYGTLGLNIKNPDEIGTDLVANAVAAWHQFKAAAVVVDFGTALSFTAINPQGQIEGVSIAPGLHTAMRSLFTNTAQLPEIPLEFPASAIGKDTVHAIQAGILYGYVGLVEKMLEHFEVEMNQKLKVAATGGLAAILTPLQDRFEVVDPLLTLRGLYYIAAS